MADSVLDRVLKPPSSKVKLQNHFNITKPDQIHQVDLLHMPADGRYKYILCVVDVASRYKAGYHLTSTKSAEARIGLEWIYKNTKLDVPDTMNVDGGVEFLGEVKLFCKEYDVKLVVNNPSFHLSIVENFNKQLAQRLFKHQQLKELETGKPDTHWVKNLQPEINTRTSDCRKFD